MNLRPRSFVPFLLLITCATIAPAQDPPLPLTHSELRAELFGSVPLPPPSQDKAELQPAAERVKKKVGLAAIYSLLLPGMGEWYADRFSTGKYFLMAEGGLWLTYAGFQLYGDALRDDARAFAAAHAGVAPAGKSEQYFVDLGNFLTLEAYNEKQLRDREPERLYSAAAGYGWNWDSDAARAAYRTQRVGSDNVYNNRKFVIAAVLLNHVVSAINAARAAVAYNEELDHSAAIQIEATTIGGVAQPHGILLTIRTPF